MAENEVHLHEDKDHVKHWIRAEQEGPLEASLRDLEKGQKFEASIDEGSEAEEDGADPQNEAAVAFLIFRGHQLDMNHVIGLSAAQKIVCIINMAWPFKRPRGCENTLLQ